MYFALNVLPGQAAPAVVVPAVLEGEGVVGSHDLEGLDPVGQLAALVEGVLDHPGDEVVDGLVLAHCSPCCSAASPAPAPTAPPFCRVLLITALTAAFSSGLPVRPFSNQRRVAGEVAIFLIRP